MDARQNVKQYVNSEVFDVLVFSAEEGVKKPDPAIYRQTLARLGVDPQEAIFNDDRLPNIIGARRIGVQAIHHVEKPRSIEEIPHLLQTPSLLIRF